MSKEPAQESAIELMDQYNKAMDELTALRAENEAFKLDAQRQLCIDRRQHEENLALSELLSCPDIHDERMNHIAALKAREGKMRETLVKIWSRWERGCLDCALMAYTAKEGLIAPSTTPPTDEGKQG